MTDDPEEMQSDEIRKLATIATDMQLAPKLRTQAIELIGSISNHKALLALLALAANTNLNISERDLALKKARDVVKSDR